MDDFDKKMHEQDLKRTKKVDLIKYILDFEEKAESKELELAQKIKDLEEKAFNLSVKLSGEIAVSDSLRRDIKVREEKIDDLIIKTITVKKHNERNAGRKDKFTAAQKEQIILQKQSMTYKEVAEYWNCSINTILKVIKNNKN